MKYKLLFTILLFAQLSFSQDQNQVKAVLPEIITQFPNVRDFTIASDQDEAWFTAQSVLGELSVIMHITKKNDKWSAPQIAEFSGKYQDMEPFLTADGLKLYFASNRPKADTSSKTQDFDIWFLQRNDRHSKWSAPINVGPPVNSKDNEFYPSVALSKNIYFTSDAIDPQSKDNIYMCRWDNSAYSKPVSLGDSINTSGYEFNAYVAPDESYIIFTGYNRKDGMGSGDLYISYKKPEGLWSKAKNLGGQINSKYMDYCPFVDTNNRILYFTSRRSNLRGAPQSFGTLKDFLKEVNTYENGSSRIYQVSQPDFILER